MSSGVSKRHCAYCLAEMEAGDSKKCGGCNKRTYCSRDCQKNDWSLKKDGQGHKNWCKLDCGEQDVDWTVSPVPGKGLGIVALRDIPSKYRLLVERPVSKFHPRVADLMPENGTPYDKFKLNALSVPPGSDVENALCLRISRANHSCDDNASHHYENELKVMILFAERDIKKGEEICISYIAFKYLGKSEVPESSRFKLRLTWGITCDKDCLCYNKEYNEKVKYARELDENILELGSKMDSEGAMIQVRKLIALEEELKLSLITRPRTFVDGFQVAIMKKETVQEGLHFLAKAYEIVKDICHPEKSETVQNIKMWMANPKSHPVYLQLG